MNKKAKLLDKMRANPRDNWTIQDIINVARQFEGIGLKVRAPTRGSHYIFSHPELEETLSIPARRPIKTFYVQRFLSIIDSIT